MKINFKVAKSWISENSIDVSTIVLSRYSGGVWNELPTTQTGEDDTYFYFEAISPGLSFFAITAQQVVATTTTTIPTTTTTTIPPVPDIYWAVGGIVALVIVILVLVIWKFGKLKQQAKLISSNFQ